MRDTKFTKVGILIILLLFIYANIPTEITPTYATRNTRTEAQYGTNTVTKNTKAVTPTRSAFKPPLAYRYVVDPLATDCSQRDAYADLSYCDLSNADLSNENLFSNS